MLLENLDNQLENAIYESEIEDLEDLEAEEEVAFEEALELDEEDIDAILNGEDDIPDEYEGYDANESFDTIEEDFDAAIESVLGGDFLEPFDEMDELDKTFELDLESSLEALAAAVESDGEDDEEDEDDDFDFDDDDFDLEGCAKEGDEEDFDFDEDDIDEEGSLSNVKGAAKAVARRVANKSDDIKFEGTRTVSADMVPPEFRARAEKAERAAKGK